ncbi:MAG: hypothetical protein PQJ61_02090 [Spirochaetales bacterium]|uniref:Uncharacterized protein n=1 Tax=Candidatus Thalassospirochaeta sargassi TaxID=3119039 RepID=A0AAJ1IDR8_9SPIO|nr:hypothetical protein [Spirochaetales bacterium]
MMLLQFFLCVRDCSINAARCPGGPEVAGKRLRVNGIAAESPPGKLHSSFPGTA